MAGPDEPTQDRVIADALIDDIVEWRIKPGSWIKEREIAERFGVSHAPVREAFRHVANTGFIDVVPWRGAHVIDIDEHAATEIFELWKAMFGVVCRLAAAKMSPEQCTELRARLVDYTELVHRTRNTFEHLSASNRIGAYIARKSGAAFATELLNRIALFARWQHHVIAEEYFDSGAGIRSAELYHILIDAIADKDGDAADLAARNLLGHLQLRSMRPLEDYLHSRATGNGGQGARGV